MKFESKGLWAVLSGHVHAQRKIAGAATVVMAAISAAGAVTLALLPLAPVSAAEGEDRLGCRPVYAR
jgi:hypothetical protein